MFRKVQLRGILFASFMLNIPFSALSSGSDENVLAVSTALKPSHETSGDSSGKGGVSGRNEVKTEAGPSGHPSQGDQMGKKKHRVIPVIEGFDARLEILSLKNKALGTFPTNELIKLRVKILPKNSENHEVGEAKKRVKDSAPASSPRASAGGEQEEQAAIKRPSLNFPQLIAFDAVMPEHEHGMFLKAKIVKVANDTYLVSGIKLHMGGYWQLKFNWQYEGRQFETKIDENI